MTAKNIVETRPTPIAVAVVQQAGRYLIGRRPRGATLGGLWEFPGGKIRAGESPDEAAVRECLEETGLDVRPTGHYGEVVHQYAPGEAGTSGDPFAVRLHFVACQPLDAAAQPRQPFLWVPAAALADYEFPAANAALVERLGG